MSKPIKILRNRDKNGYYEYYASNEPWDSFSSYRKIQDFYKKHTITCDFQPPSEEDDLFNRYKAPEFMRAELSYLAYERGHSSGQEEVIYVLEDLLGGLEKSFAEINDLLVTKNCCKSS